MPTSSSTDLRPRLREQLRTCAYPGYVYGYPHKKAYRPLAPRLVFELPYSQFRELDAPSREILRGLGRPSSLAPVAAVPRAHERSSRRV